MQLRWVLLPPSALVIVGQSSCLLAELRVAAEAVWLLIAVSLPSVKADTLNPVSVGDKGDIPSTSGGFSDLFFSDKMNKNSLSRDGSDKQEAPDMAQNTWPIIGLCLLEEKKGGAQPHYLDYGKKNI